MTLNESKTFLVIKYGSLSEAFDLWLSDPDKFGNEHYELIAEMSAVLIRKLQREISDLEIDGDYSYYTGDY